MRVAHLTSVHSIHDPRILYKECASLTDTGYDVFLVGPHEEDVRLRGVAVCGVRKPKSRLDRILNTTREVISRAKSLNPDVYHLHDPELLPWTSLLLGSKAIVIYDMHEDLIASVGDKKWIPSVLRPLLPASSDFLLRLFLRNRPTVFAELSYAERYSWIDQSAIVQNMPIVSELTKINEPKYDVMALGYIGRVSEARGSITTMQALKKLKDIGYEVGWECVGMAEPGHRAELHRLKDKFGLTGVRMPGYLPAEEGLRRVGRCHIGLAILDKAPNYVGSYPTKLFEYMALGLPVIATDVKLYSEVVEDCECGIVVDPEDVNDVTLAIKHLIDNPYAAREMGERGRAMVERKYSWENEARNLVEFYNWCSD